LKTSDITLASDQHCRLLRPVRDHVGRTRSDERPIILRHVRNLDRSMCLVQFSDGSTTFLFPGEVAVDNPPFADGIEGTDGHAQNFLH
jgi:hypothetical protein